MMCDYFSRFASFLIMTILPSHNIFGMVGYTNVFKDSSSNRSDLECGVQFFFSSLKYVSSTIYPNFNVHVYTL